jgi:serine phosphatase RsbU (regulator of sigma subunit)
MGARELELSARHEASSEARREVAASLSGTDLAHLTDDAQLVASELVSNALLHGSPPIRLGIDVGSDRVRLAVFDSSATPPGRNHTGETAMTGRGLMVVEALTVRRGVERNGSGKQVWAELSGDASEHADDLLGAFLAPDGLIDAWADTVGPVDAVEVDLGDVPTKLLLAAKVHTENLVRELTLAFVGAEVGGPAMPEELARLVTAVTTEFSELRRELKDQALAADAAGKERTHLRVRLTPQAIENGERYLEALDEADSYCHAGRLLSLETPPQHKVFRRWYVGELSRQVKRSVEGLPPHAPQSFEDRLLDELNVLAAAERAAGRAARLHRVSASLAAASSSEQVARVVLEEAVPALGAIGGGLLVPAGAKLALPGAVGYRDELVSALRDQPADSDLPAAVALRTGQPVWLESTKELDRRFPEVRSLEPETESVCAVPLSIDSTVAAIRFSFAEPRLFDADERAFILAVAGQGAQALDRVRLLEEERAAADQLAALYQHETEVAQALQRTLLPPALPAVPGIEVAAAYRPAAEDVGGDFYDLWPLEKGVWGFAVGDVCGIGADAAAFNAIARATCRALSITGADPAEWLRGLNTALLLGAAEEPQGVRFCTVVVGTLRLEGDGAVLRLATGGHPPPILRRPGSPPVSVPITGTLIGALDEVRIGELDVRLDPGDQLVLYTDGVTDVRQPDGTILGERGLLGMLGAPDQPPEALVRDLVARLWADRPPDDDVALLVLGPQPAREAG